MRLDATLEHPGFTTVRPDPEPIVPVSRRTAAGELPEARRSREARNAAARPVQTPGAPVAAGAIAAIEEARRRRAELDAQEREARRAARLKSVLAATAPGPLPVPLGGSSGDGDAISTHPPEQSAA